jgi:hypothetical protein
VTNLDQEPSLHYVDASGRPLDVRQWYRFWVIFLFGLAAWLAYAVASTPGIGGFDAGTCEGGSAASAVLAITYAIAWAQDVRRRRADRRYWVRHNRKTANRMVVLGAIGTTACLLGVPAAVSLGDTYVSGLLLGPGAAAFFCLALGAQVRQNQRRRGE